MNNVTSSSPLLRLHMCCNDELSDLRRSTPAIALPHAEGRGLAGGEAARRRQAAHAALGELTMEYAVLLFPFSTRILTPWHCAKSLSGCTRIPLKPSQTCHRCGIQHKKTLSVRRHVCACGANCSRDENAARVMLNWALANATGQELAEVGSGGCFAVLNHETHAVPLGQRE